MPQALSGPFSVVCAGQREPGGLRSGRLADIQQQSLSFLQSLKVCPAPVLLGGCGSSGGGWWGMGSITVILVWATSLHG